MKKIKSSTNAASRPNKLRVIENDKNVVLPFRYKSQENFRQVKSKNENLLPLTSRLSNIERLENNNSQLKSALEMANIIAHNIKSPLMALELLVVSDGLSSETQGLIRETLDQVYEKIKEINLLDSVEKVATANQTLQKTDLNQLVKECFKDSVYLYRKNSSIEFNLISNNEKLFGLVCPEDFKKALLHMSH